MTAAKRAVFFGALCAGLLTGGCEHFCDVAEFDALEKPTVAFKQFQEGPALHVAGQVRRTDGVVESVRQIREGRDLRIEVLVSPFERDDTGSEFSTDVFLDGIDRITFGEKNTLLWRRYPDDRNLPSKPKPVFKLKE